MDKSGRWAAIALFAAYTSALGWCMLASYVHGIEIFEIKGKISNLPCVSQKPAD